MTISTTTSSISYSGNGVTTGFAVPFPFFASDELEVIERVTSTGVETVKTLTTHYTVAGGDGATGTVTMLTAPASGRTLTIRRNTDRTQETDYPENDPFPAASHERALDRLTAIVQEVERDQTGRALLVAKTDGAVGVLPNSVDRGGKYLGFDSSGNPIAVAAAVGSTVVSTYAATLLDDADAAAAAVTLSVGPVVKTAGYTAAGTDYGGLIVFNIAAAATLALPALSGVVAGTPIRVLNLSTSAGYLTIDPNASETVNGATTQYLFPGESCTLYASASGWYMYGVDEGWRVLRKQTASASATLDFLLPTSMRAFRLSGWLQVATDLQSIILRTSTNGGSSYDAGASDYGYTIAQHSSVAAWGVSNSFGVNGMIVVPSTDNASASQVNFRGDLIAGDGTRSPRWQGTAGGAFDGGSGGYAGAAIVNSYRVSATQANAVRVLASSGNITGHVILEGIV